MPHDYYVLCDECNEIVHQYTCLCEKCRNETCIHCLANTYAENHPGFNCKDGESIMYYNLESLGVIKDNFFNHQYCNFCKGKTISDRDIIRASAELLGYNSLNEYTKYLKWLKNSGCMNIDYNDIYAPRDLKLKMLDNHILNSIEKNYIDIIKSQAKTIQNLEKIIKEKNYEKM